MTAEEISQASLCESVLQPFGSVSSSDKVKSLLRLKQEFLRLDGQCKLCLVGAGAAEGNLRLPPLGFVFYIWDHAPGYHYVTEAGGKVTDLDGYDLDFTDRILPNVTGVVSTNRLLHDMVVSAVNHEKK